MRINTSMMMRIVVVDMAFLAVLEDVHRKLRAPAGELMATWRAFHDPRPGNNGRATEEASCQDPS
jgi:hypothetical protein